MDSFKSCLPDNTNLFMLVKREKIDQKAFTEKAFDFLFTLGNERYKEYYYFIMKRNDGSLFIEQRIYINEMNAASFRGVEEFDHREEVKKQISLYCQIKKMIEQSVKGKVDQKLIDELVQLIGEKISKQLLSKLYMVGQIGKATAVTGLAGLKKIVEYTSLQTFKVVNNALVKQGIKGFMSIGGKKMLVEGAKVVVTQSGKQFAAGTVVEVGKQTVTIGTQVASTTLKVGSCLKGLGVGLALNAVLGGIKSAINTDWQKDSLYICECHAEFNFNIIKNPEKMIEQLKVQANEDDNVRYEENMNKFNSYIQMEDDSLSNASTDTSLTRNDFY